MDGLDEVAAWVTAQEWIRQRPGWGETSAIRLRNGLLRRSLFLPPQFPTLPS